jgi:hypothetical protein
MAQAVCFHTAWAHCRDRGRPSWRPVIGVVLPSLRHQGHKQQPMPRECRQRWPPTSPQATRPRHRSSDAARGPHGPHPIRHREALAFHPVLDSGEGRSEPCRRARQPRGWAAPGSLTQVDMRIGRLPPKTAPAFRIEAIEVPWPITASAGPITEVEGIFRAKNHHPICDLTRWLPLR